MSSSPHRRGLLALLLALALPLAGCAALLERDYTHITPHSAVPATEGDPSILRADSYQELVNALVYFVNLGAEEGTVRLYLDSDQVESQLEAACLEVVQEDPLGSYAVEFIKYSASRVVTYTQADVSITYRRTREQVSSIVQATGVTAIRGELKSALAAFAPSCVLSISYFDGDEEFIRTLARQAYYDAPAAILAPPQVEVAIYPDSGRQRIVEITLTYPQGPDQLEQRRQELTGALEALARELEGLEGDALTLTAARRVLEQGVWDMEGGTTAWDWLLEGRADSEGVALALAALFQQLELPCYTTQGTLEEEARVWNVIQTQDGWRHLDLSQTEDPLALYTDQELAELGYSWDTTSLPSCLPAPGAQVILPSGEKTLS